MIQPDDANVLTDSTKSIKSVYRICIETRNFEIAQLIQRNNFFMLFQGVLLAAALQNEAGKPYVEFVISLIGVFVSYYQLQMSCGAKFWQEWWESRVEELESTLKNSKAATDNDFVDLFNTSSEIVKETVARRLNKNRKSNFIDWLILKKYSVSRAPILVSLALLLGWAALTIQTLNLSGVTISFQNLDISVSGFNFPNSVNKNLTSQEH